MKSFLGLLGSGYVVLCCVTSSMASDTLNILLVGQSNMHGSLGSNIFVPMPEELRSGTGSKLSRTWLTWYGKPGDSNRYRLHVVRPYSYSAGIWGPEVYGGWTLANPSYDVVMTKASIGGVSLNTFLPGNTGWDLILSNYSITQSESVVEGLDPLGEIDVLWWGQGESGSSPVGSYYAQLVGLIDDLRTQFASPNMKVVFMGLGRGWSDTNEADLAFKNYVSENPGSALYVSGKELDLRLDHVVEFSAESGAGPHYSAIGMKRLGVRMASATLALMEPDGDVDQDGLAAITEFHAGTDPSVADTDGDGVNDGLEYLAGGDPLHDDSQTFAAISAKGENYDLYSSSAILELKARQVSGVASGGQGSLTFTLYASDNLSSWVPFGEPLVWEFPINAEKRFFRLGVNP
jgi:hypothetical protein